MSSSNKPPKKKKGIPEGPANPKDLQPAKREHPAATERTEAQPESDKASHATPDATSPAREPVTNQDEQDRITNAADSQPVPEK